MKKSIIAASAASVALAAMPMVGAFAAVETDIVTDEIVYNLSETCSLTRTGLGHDADADPADDFDGTWSATSAAVGAYTATMSAGETAKLGTSTFTVACNDETNGYNLKVVATGLQKGSDYIDYSATGVNTSSSSWNIAISAIGGGLEAQGVFGGLTNENYVNINYTQNQHTGTAYLIGAAEGDNPTYKTAIAGGTFKATYNVGTTTTQAAGQYRGSAAYTLTWGANS